MAKAQFTFQDINENTGFGLCWYQGNTSNTVFNDMLTTLPTVYVENPPPMKKNREKLMIYIAPEIAALAFYLLMQVGEVKCVSENIFEIDAESLAVLHNSLIGYGVIQ